jgi:hypothetical protein
MEVGAWQNTLFWQLAFVDASNSMSPYGCGKSDEDSPEK